MLSAAVRIETRTKRRNQGLLTHEVAQRGGDWELVRWQGAFEFCTIPLQITLIV